MKTNYDKWILRLDRMDHLCNDGEILFLEKIMRYRDWGWPLIRKYKERIDYMVRKYWRFVHYD